MRTTVTLIHRVWCALTPEVSRPSDLAPAFIVARVQNGHIEHLADALR